MDYDTFRHLADTWGLVYLLTVLVAVVAFTFRPGARRHHADAAMIPFKEERDV